MFYWLFFEKLFHLYSPFRVFQYSTFRTALASITALFLCMVLGPWLIASLREFQIGQHIREDGPKSHQKKAGTPTMGGVLICVSIVVPTLLWANLRTRRMGRALRPPEFRRHWILGRLHEVARKRNLGLTGQHRISPRDCLASMFVGVLLLWMNRRGAYSTNMNVPFSRNSSRICSYIRCSPARGPTPWRLSFSSDS